jgi:hypothetical protein
VAFLSREVPRWAREHRCYSCHNNGVAARALFRAAQAGFDVPRQAVADTTSWLKTPENWDQNGGDGPFSDKRLARIAFSAALATAVQTGRTRDTLPMHQAGARLVVDQAGDGSWPLDGEDSTSSPATFGRPLATMLARESLEVADPVQYRGSIQRADDWLLRREIVTVTDASVCLLAFGARENHPAAERSAQGLRLLRRGQSDDGGWGPHLASPSEPFDTALALLGLANCRERASRDPMIARGRRYLISQQQEDGGWVETTRPPGAVSYAQRVATTGWATLALLATRGLSARPNEDPKR